MKKKLFFSMLIAITLSATSLVGCGSNDIESATRPTSNRQHSSSSRDEDDEDVRQKADEEPDDIDEPEDDDREFVASEVRYHINSYFVEDAEGAVYFHAPNAEGGMDEVSIGGNFSRFINGETILYKYWPDFENMQDIVYDTAGGPMAYDGDTIYYTTESVDDEGNVRDNITLLMEDDYYAGTMQRQDQYYLTNDEFNQHVAGYYYMRDDDDMVTGISLLIYGMESDCGYHEIEDYRGAIGLADGQFYYIKGDDDEYYLEQLDLEDNTTITLGQLPASSVDATLTYGICDQFASDDSRIYFSYNFYAGSGNFYNDGYFISADIGCKNSIYYESNYSDDGNTPVFMVEDGKMIKAEGVPFSAGVVDDYIGYYDAEGKWVPVASGYASGYEETGDGVYSGVDVCDYIDGKIYAIYNVSDHIPEEDIGWRMAYRRTYTKVVEIDCVTGNENVLLEVK